MPADIRTFFGGKPSGAPATSQKHETPKAKTQKGRKRNVIEDDDEDDDEVVEVKTKKSTPKKKQAKREPSPAGEVTTTSDYFGGKSKPKRSEPVSNKPATNGSATPAKKKANGSTSTKSTPNGRSSARKRNQPTSYAEDKDEDLALLDDIDVDEDDIFGADFKKKDDYQPDSDEEPVKPQKRTGRVQKKLKDDDAFEPGDEVDAEALDPEEDTKPPNGAERIVKNKPRPQKRKSKDLEEDDDDDEDDFEEALRPKKAKTTKTSPAKKQPTAKKVDGPESKEIQDILDSIPQVRAPTPPPKNGDAGPKKFQYRANGAAAAPPPAAGSKELPEGAENCLAGLTFVFTGVLQSLDREEGKELVKRYGGKVTGAPSKSTSYVILGTEAGPKKLETIRSNGIKTINEDGLFELIRRLPANGGDGKAAVKQAEKKEAEQQKIRDMAAEMEREDRARQAAAKPSTTHPKDTGKASPPGPDNRLWTVKYAPTSLNQICGNKVQVEKLADWLRNFPRSQRTGFKMAGKHGSGIYRAVMIHGPPGIGKTTAAHLVAKLEGYDVVESNASDTRSKKLVEQGLKGVLSTTSLLGYFAAEDKKVEASKKKLVLIMDEVDGMSAGDRGGVGALAAVCKKSQIPMILICNDRRQPKMKPFDYVTYELPFRRPTTDQIRSRIMTIGYREGLNLPANVVDALIEGSRADIRQVVNMVSTAKLDQESMDFDRSKSMSKNWEKHIILKPWDIISKILAGGMFAAASKATLNDKSELYFNDHEFSYLMLQENYLGTKPMAVSGIQDPKMQRFKSLELASMAADSISDGDLVDRMIHGSQQQWSLMPTHAMFSFVRPASFVAGSMAGHQTQFTSWLGKNSNQQKLTRMVKEIQGHMRLRTSGDRHEIRQQYLPLLWTELVKKLEVEGKEAVPEIIQLMDSYFLTKDDFDAIMELGVGPMTQEKVKLETQAKATFTRMYNQQAHPLPFMKASNVVAPKKVGKERPDLEEAIEESDEGEVLEPVDAKDDDEEDMDVTKDKYVKQPKKKKAAAGAAKGGAGKRKKIDEEEDADSEEQKPKRGKAAPKGKGKAKK